MKVTIILFREMYREGTTNLAINILVMVSGHFKDTLFQKLGYFG